jgi:hypothetical protein
MKYDKQYDRVFVYVINIAIGIRKIEKAICF